MFDHIYEISYIAAMLIDSNTLFSALSNEVRLRCLMLLQLEGELCVCELTHALALSQPMMSRHLALLRNSGLVTDRRVGQWIYYQINSELDDWVQQILQITVQENLTVEPFSTDLQLLNGMPDRPEVACCA